MLGCSAPPTTRSAASSLTSRLWGVVRLPRRSRRALHPHGRGVKPDRKSPRTPWQGPRGLRIIALGMTNNMPRAPVVECALHPWPPITIPDDYPEPALCLGCEARVRQQDPVALRQFDEARTAGRYRDALDLLRPFRR